MTWVSKPFMGARALPSETRRLRAFLAKHKDVLAPRVEAGSAEQVIDRAEEPKVNSWVIEAPSGYNMNGVRSGAL